MPNRHCVLKLKSKKQILRRSTSQNDIVTQSVFRREDGAFASAAAVAACIVYNRAVNLRLFSPELVEKTALGHLVKKSPINEIIGLDLFGTGIDLCDVIQDRLKSLRPDRQPRLQGFDFCVVTGFEDLTVVNPQLFAQDFEGKVFVACAESLRLPPSRA